jgi:hypothetical protein
MAANRNLSISRIKSIHRGSGLELPMQTRIGGMFVSNRVP